MSLRSNCRKSPVSGFSLIEVLIALAILSVIVGAVLALFTLGLHRVYGGKKMTEATVLAQDVMERFNQPRAHTFLDALATDATIQKSWVRQTVSGTTTITPAETLANGANFARRNEWRTLFLNSNLPAGSGADNRTELLVRATAVPSGTTFANATMIRLQVEVRWAERGTRARQVLLETLNLRQ